MGCDRENKVRRICFWVAVTLYTLALPHANLAYLFIIGRFSRNFAGKIPMALVIVTGVAYIWAGFKNKLIVRCFSFLLPCIIISYVFISLEPNPNKHIHIPEYVLMTWLIYEALSTDYTGRGLLGLVFICSSMLGMVDELFQGILPNRFYSMDDIAINTVASFMGVLTLAGLRPRPDGHWEWTKVLTKFPIHCIMIICGTAGAVILCNLLAGIAEGVPLIGIYPDWLILWNGLFTVLAGLQMVFSRPFGGLDGFAKEPHMAHAMSARLWVVIPLVILLVMHSLVLISTVLDWDFL